MKRTDLLIGLLLGTALVPVAAFAASVQYGEVTAVSVSTYEDHDEVSGAVKGGLLGKAIGPRRPGVDRGVIAGAAIGAAADDPDIHTSYLYSVEFVDGSGALQIQTEQGNIRQGDCVSVEQGQHANIRPVSSVHCEQQTSEPPAHHTNAAKECDMAKQELMAADTGEEVDIAVQKVRVLCED